MYFLPNNDVCFFYTEGCFENLVSETEQILDIINGIERRSITLHEKYDQKLLLLYFTQNNKLST